MERLGLFGGTFDPVHVGHLAAAMAARHVLALDHVVLVVAGDPWQKHGRTLAPAEDRFAMVAAAIDGVDGLRASRVEIDRGGPSYTIDTVQQLAAPGREILLIVGADVAATITTWDRADELRDLVTLAVVEREGDDRTVVPPGWHARPVPMPRLDISSSMLRTRVAAGEPVEYLVPTAAARILRARGLYTGG